MRKEKRKDAAQDNKVESVTLLLLEQCVPATNNEPVDQAEERFLSICRTVASGGVRAPIIVRPHPTEKGKYEIRDGERRWRAARKAGLPVIPAVIRCMDDAEAAALTEILNTDRRELPPLRQGMLVAQVLAAHGGDLKAAAAVLGQSPHWVATRAQLAALTDEWRSEFANPDSRYAQWTMAHWIQIARLPAEAQLKAFKELAKMYSGAPKSAADLEELLGGMQQLLSDAPWALDDGLLVRKAGPCAACIKRTEARGQLFYERLDPEAVKADDRCLDPGCWRRKVKTYAEAKVAETLAKHPEAIKVSTTTSVKDALKYYEYEAATKSTKGAVLAVIVSPERAGQTTYVKVNERMGSQYRERAEPTLEERLAMARQMVQHRRDEALLELFGSAARGKRMKTPKAEMIVRLAAAVGAIAEVDLKLPKAPMPKVMSSLWQGVIRSVESELPNCESNDEWRGLMDLILTAGGTKLVDLEAEAAKVEPEPPEIAELEAQIKAEKEAK